jgi:hypothetical protein
MWLMLDDKLRSSLARMSPTLKLLTTVVDVARNMAPRRKQWLFLMDSLENKRSNLAFYGILGEQEAHSRHQRQALYGCSCSRMWMLETSLEFLLFFFNRKISYVPPKFVSIPLYSLRCSKRSHPARAQKEVIARMGLGFGRCCP